MDRSEVAIIIPAYNEAATIERVVQSVSLYGQAIVVDDCSTDATAALAARAGAVVIKHGSNRGYDGALNSGFREAGRRGFQYAVTFDADGQHEPALLRKFVEYLNLGYDLVVGVRPQYARFAERLFALYTRSRFGLRDPLCGMKGYRMRLYQARGWFDSYQSIGTELALYAASQGMPYAQLAVPIKKRTDAPRFAQWWRANWKILRALLLSWAHV